ncbi:hypothetical protein [Methylobacterium oxalidis]|uniref:hypothetical protein n=1 Tax=Methylobacterium oxalidis TaxID=944322 RepID=UPI0024E066DC|nr:hypothetical protein [Methylobacterium oxalidis]
MIVFFPAHPQGLRLTNLRLPQNGANWGGSCREHLRIGHQNRLRVAECADLQDRPLLHTAQELASRLLFNAQQPVREIDVSFSQKVEGNSGRGAFVGLGLIRHGLGSGKYAPQRQFILAKTIICGKINKCYGNSLSYSSRSSVGLRTGTRFSAAADVPPQSQHAQAAAAFMLKLRLVGSSKLGAVRQIVSATFEGARCA